MSGQITKLWKLSLISQGRNRLLEYKILLLRLQPYNFRVIHKSGLTNEAEYSNRHQIDIKTKWSSEERIAEEYINYIVQHTIPKSLTWKEIQQSENKTIKLGS